MTLDPEQLPDDVVSLKAMLIAAAHRVNDLDAEIESLKLTIAKLQHARFGPSSERGARLLDQLELQLGELVERRAQEQAAAEIEASPRRAPIGQARAQAAAQTGAASAARASSARASCTALAVGVPVLWRPVAQPRRGHHRDAGARAGAVEGDPARAREVDLPACEAITQPPAPSHPIARGRAGPQLLADVLFGKYGAHLPLNRQSDIYAREGIDLDVSTLADWVGASAATLMPLRDAIEAHVHAIDEDHGSAMRRIHVDDTTVPVLAKGKCRTGRVWSYVRDDRPFGGKAAPAVVLYYSPTARASTRNASRQLHRHHAGRRLLGLQRALRRRPQPGPIIEAACWAHGRRKFFELARFSKMPIAIEAVRRIDELFAIEREINGLSPEHVSPFAASDPSRSSTISRAGCARSVASSPPRTRWPRPSTTASSAGRRSRASSTTAASACRTTPPSAPSAPSR